MPIRVALHHLTRYRYDRPVGLSPHEVRLRPAAHTRTPVLSYSLSCKPAEHFVNWQQDPYGNYIARYVFPEKTRELEFVVDLVVDMTVINPFDFFVEPHAEFWPFEYEPLQRRELAPYLEPEQADGERFEQLVQDIRAHWRDQRVRTVDFVVDVNRRLQQGVNYLVRMEPGVQAPEQTLELASGSCRDSAWLLAQVLRRLGIATRFVSGYLIQLASDQKSLDGPSGPAADFTDLHAWTEVYLPGAGWIGLDPTSGLLAGEGHIPLACAASPTSAAPVVGASDVAGVEFSHQMSVQRIHEDPRVTLPYADDQWDAILALGESVDQRLTAMDVRLTLGGEPTFVSIDDMEGAQWNTAALGDDKRRIAGELFERLQARFARGALLHYGQGKWYPGEALPRWALTAIWRTDGVPVWNDPALLSTDAVHETRTAADATRYARALTARLRLDPALWMPAWEPQAVPVDGLMLNGDGPGAGDGAAAGGRAGDAAGAADVAGWVVPLASDAAGLERWRTDRWPVPGHRLVLVPGDSPVGLRLPLNLLPPPPAVRSEHEREQARRERARLRAERRRADGAAAASYDDEDLDDEPDPVDPVVRTALAVQCRDGQLCVFLPPFERAADFLAAVAAVEAAAADTGLRVRVEGYTAPREPLLRVLAVTPDPGVIEVNVQPSGSWRELVRNTEALYAIARECRLGTEKFMLDGRHTGTGGGNHVTLGGATPDDSPLLRRPELLRSLIGYWQNHPSLSYLFSGTFIGPTSQAPRVDEARDDNLYELQIAFQQMQRVLPGAGEAERPLLIDRLLRHLLVDLTGNTHRAEFSIDKLWAQGPTGHLGLLELRAFEMPPHARMSLVQMLLLRALVARFWKTPWNGRLQPWGTALHDRWMLPHFIAQDIRHVCLGLREHDIAFQDEWLAPFLEFRFPRYGSVERDGIELELRAAIEPWHVLGEEVGRQGTARYVDSSVERLQVRVRGLTGTRHAVTCNGRPVPLQATGVPGEYVAGVRYRAWAPPSALHPTIPVQAPLHFDLVDRWAGRAIGGCVYRVVHAGGRSYDTFPVNANEAEARRVARFEDIGHTPGPLVVPDEAPNPAFPCTLDLRWQP